MTRIFADNVGIVQIYNKDVAVPANVEVVIKAEGHSISSKFSIFSTAFSASKKSQFMPKQSLDNITHFIPFGHAPEVITLSGITFGYQQTNPGGLFSTLRPRIKTIIARNPPQYPPRSLEEAKVKTFKILDWMDQRTWVLERAEAFERSSVVVGVLTTGLSALAKVVNTVKVAVEAVIGIPGVITSSLGLAVDKQLPGTLSHNADSLPLTFPELHSLFDHMQLGSHDRASDGEFLNVDFCGVRYRCALSQIDFTAKSADNVIEFIMELICIGDALHLAPAKPNIVKTRPAGVLTLLMQVTQASGHAAMANIRSSDASIGPVSIGRLLG